jgi:hypothetical protein
MKNFIITALILLTTQSLSAQSINNFTAATPQHILIAGTNIYLIPPAGFAPSKTFKGFQNPTNPSSMIMVLELPAPYSEMEKGFDKDKMAKSGMNVTSKEEINLNGTKGMLLEIEQEANATTFSKTILVFENGNSTTMINGVYVKGLPIGKLITESIKSTFFNAQVKRDARAALDYTVDETVGNLKFNHVLGNGLLINRDGKIPTQSLDKVSLITDRSFAKVKIDNKKLFCLTRLRKISEKFEIVEEKGLNEITLDGLKGYEVYAKNTSENKDIYQAIVFEEDGGYYLFVGQYATENPAALTDIKKIIQTFKRKK